MYFTNRVRALAANMLQNVVRQETTRIHVPSPSFQNAQKFKHRFFLHNDSVHNWVRQETTKINVPSSGLKTQKNRKTSKILLSKRRRRSDPKRGGPGGQLPKVQAIQRPPNFRASLSSLPSLADRTALARRIIRG